jgi:hypothetical protein
MGGVVTELVAAMTAVSTRRGAMTAVSHNGVMGRNDSSVTWWREMTAVSLLPSHRRTSLLKLVELARQLLRLVFGFLLHALPSFLGLPFLRFDQRFELRVAPLPETRWRREGKESGRW